MLLRFQTITYSTGVPKNTTNNWNKIIIMLDIPQGNPTKAKLLVRSKAVCDDTSPPPEDHGNHGHQSQYVTTASSSGSISPATITMATLSVSPPPVRNTKLLLWRILVHKIIFRFLNFWYLLERGVEFTQTRALTMLTRMYTGMLNLGGFIRSICIIQILLMTFSCLVRSLLAKNCL